MNAFSYHHFDLLKDLVLKEAGFDFLTTAECSYLSLLILKKTKKSISETTLKRVYGFANSRFKPSAFTLNTLSEFCGFSGWRVFCEHKEKPHNINLAENDIYVKANIITKNTLQALKNRSTIPYYHTIDRRIFHEHMQEFKNGNYLATVFVGPTGSGKTIGLCHWITEQISMNTVTKQNDIYLLFSSHVINISLLYNNLEEWLLNLIGIQNSYDLISFFEKTNKKLYIIIDGFDDYLFKAEEFDTLFNQMIDLIACYKDHKWFKLILTMSSYTWSTIQNRINKHYSIRDRWYLGIMQDDKTLNRNVVPFSHDEMLVLSERINPDEPLPKKINDEILHFLGHPEYFAYFYRLYPENFSLNNIKPAFVYHILSQIILDKIYKGRSSTDNITLIKSLVQKMNWQKQELFVSKHLFSNIIKSCNSAYKELYTRGIICEANTSGKLHYKENIYFGNNHITRYFLAKRLLDENNDKISQKIVDNAQNAVVGEDDYLGVLKWVILYAITIEDYSVFKYLCRIKLYPVEKVSLMIFICDYLNENHADLYQQKDFNNFLQKDFIFFNSFLKISLITPQYNKGISHLLRFNLPEEKKIIINCLTVIFDLFTGNIESARKKLSDLLNIVENIPEKWPVNPVLGLYTILQYFVYGQIETDFFKVSTQILFQPKKLNRYKNVHEFVFIIAIYTNLLLNNFKKSARFLQVIRNAIPQINDGISAELNLCMSMIDCNLAIYNGEDKRASALYTFLQNRFYYQQTYFTSTVRLFFLMLKTQMITILNREDNLMSVINQVNSLTTSSNYVFFNMLNKSFIINTSNINHLPDEEMRSIYLTLVKMVRAKGYRLESFVNTYTYDINSHKMKAQA